MITFPLKVEYYRKIEAKNKTHEYRPVNEYWTTRLKKLKKDDIICFSLGYTEEKLYAKIISIKTVHVTETNNCLDLINIYSEKYRYYHDIYFELIDMEEQ